MEIKKSNTVDIEKTRLPVFIVALLCVCSFFYVAIQWHVPVTEPDIDKILEAMEQDLDLEKMKEKIEMVAAISEEVPHEVATTTKEVPKAETVQQMMDVEPQVETIETTTNEIIVNEEKPEVEEAKIEEVLIEQVQEDSKLAEEIHFKSIPELPEFPGGHSAFIKWIDTNLKYPANAVKSKVEGKVVVSFVIDVEGNATDIKLVQKLNFDIDTAVLTLFAKMPKWKPGTRDGKPCPTMIAVPVNFEI